MDQREFDRFADEYHAMHARNIRLSGEDPAYFARYKARDAARLTGGTLPVPSVLDFGTGVGNSLPFLHDEFPSCRLVGIDVSVRSLEIARTRCSSYAELREFDGTGIPFDDHQFGLTLAACVFHHIEPAEHVAKLREIRRVLAPGGSLMLYEHNPWNPLTVRAVNDCPFDENAQLIAAPVLKQRALEAGFSSVKVRFRVFFPALLAALRVVEPMLSWVPLGAQYCVVCRK